jgi:hypothetical protein
MKIESLLRRPGGTKVTLDGREYHFKPDAQGREIADVLNSDHVGIFASIREGYRILPDDPRAETRGSAKTQGQGGGEGGEQTGDGLDALTREQLAELHTQKFGRPPATNLSKAKIIEALREPAA